MATADRDDPLTDFSPREIEIDGISKRVYVSGHGPGVIVMAEMPGISPHVARFARWVRQAGFTVYMPSLFGRDGAVPSAEEGVDVLKRACINAEFRALGGNASSPVSKWLAAWPGSPCPSAGLQAWVPSGCALPATSPSR